jgi:hypothetical protein
MRKQNLRAGDEVAIVPYESAPAELVCEIAKIQRVNGSTIHLESGRVYSKASGRGLTPVSRGVIVPATTEHWESIRARYGMHHKTCDPQQDI